MNYNEFAETVKAKYPEYKDKDNRILAEAIVKKYPEYASKVTFNETPAKEGMSFKGLLKNIGKEVVSAAEQVKQGAYDLPVDATNTMTQMVQGMPYGNTPLGQQAAGIANTVPELPGKMVEAAKHPIQTAYENPLTAATLVYGGAKGLGKLASLGMEKTAPALGGVLESAGAKGQNFAAGIRPQTIESMTKAGQNPGDIGVKVGSRLAQERIVGSTPKQTYSNLIKAKDTAGKEVGQAIEEIHGAGKAAVNAEEALAPLKDVVKEYSEAVTGVKRNLTKHFEEVYNYFVKASEEDGQLSLDQVRKAIKEVGPLTSSGSEEAQAAMSKLYGTLMNVQDNIIEGIAAQAKNPKLKASLLKANEKFSFYKRIEHDLKRAAAKEVTGKEEGFISAPLKIGQKLFDTQFSGLMNRAGTKLKGFPMESKNLSELQSLRDRLKTNAK